MRSTDVYLCRETQLFPELNKLVGNHFYYAEEKFTEVSLLAKKIGYCVFCVVSESTKTVLRFVYKYIDQPEKAAKCLCLTKGEKAIFIRV